LSKLQNLSGKIEIMLKIEMRKLGLKSPDQADALMLTFVKADSQDPPVARSFRPKSTMHKYMRT
jgi:hypothetical protein